MEDFYLKPKSGSMKEQNVSANYSIPVNPGASHLSTAAQVGIIIGLLAFFAIVGILIYVSYKHNLKKRIIHKSVKK